MKEMRKIRLNKAFASCVNVPSDAATIVFDCLSVYLRHAAHTFAMGELLDCIWSARRRLRAHIKKYIEDNLCFDTGDVLAHNRVISTLTRFLHLPT